MVKVNVLKKRISFESFPRNIRQKLIERCEAETKVPEGVREISYEELPKRIRQKFERNGVPKSKIIKRNVIESKITTSRSELDKRISIDNIKIFLGESKITCRKKNDSLVWVRKSAEWQFDSRVIVRVISKGYVDIRIYTDVGFQILDCDVLGFIKELNDRHKDLIFYVDEEENLCLNAIVAIEQHTVSDVCKILCDVLNVMDSVYPAIKKVIWCR